MTRQEQMTITVRVTDGWMVKALAKQIHTMKWNGRAPGVIVQGRREGVKAQVLQALINNRDALNAAYYGEERKVL